MTGTTPQIEWYIGRDGQRHGPISDDEMCKFVELGHLRPTDLVWCQSFTEWKPASQVFPRNAAATPVSSPTTSQPSASKPSASQAQPASAPATQPSARQSPVVIQQPAPTASAATSGTAAPAAASSVAASSPVVPPSAAPVAKHTQPASISIQHSAAQASPTSPSSVLNDDAAWAEAMRGVLQPTAPNPSSRPGSNVGHAPTQPTPQPVAPQTFSPEPSAQPAMAGAAGAFASIDTSPQPVPSPRFGQAEPGWESASAPVAEDFEPPRKRRDWIAVAAGAIAVILVICGLAWITWQNRALVSGASAIGSAIKATVATTPSAESYRLSPYDAPGETRDAIDAALQRTAIWRILKRDHPQWYAERVGDIEQRRAQKIDDKVIARFMADVIVTLRRNNALAALQSSPEHMRQMARTFGENLRQLASRDGSTCFAFITFGEANPFSLELARTPAFAETLQRQLVSIFEAIANGKAVRQIHPNTRRNDYDLLTKELTNRGWSQNDLAIFSDPSRLSASPPEKVCSLVQEWFATHLALTDTDLQARLLAESLKPLVGG